MRTLLMLSVVLSAVLCGCRREDIREFTITLPQLKEQDRATVVQALAPYQGIDRDSFKWDMAAKTLTLSYDSMQIAKENIRQAIEAKSIEVAR